MKIPELFKFISFLHQSVNVKRSTKIKGRGSFENNAEHSYQLALIAWYFIDYYKMDLNKELVLKYALAHDLVEAYAGDTDPHIHRKEFRASKQEREHKAQEKIKKEFSGFGGLTNTIENYEKRKDPEAQLVYALDKLTPVINTYLAGDAYYQKQGVSFDGWKQWLRDKIESAGLDDPVLEDLLNKVIQFFQETKGFFRE